MTESLDYEALKKEGIYNPDAENAKETKELIELLATVGACTQDIIKIHKEGSPIWWLAYDLARAAETSYSAQDMVNLVGNNLNWILRIYENMGLSIDDVDEKKFDEDDVSMLNNLQDIMNQTHTNDDGMAELARVFGVSISRMADASILVYISNFLRDNMSELDMVKFSIGSADQHLIDPAMQIVGVVLRHHVKKSLQRHTQAQIEEKEFGTLQMGVGFLDIVGYTPYLGDLPAKELRKLISHFEDESIRISGQHNGKLVKTIGDEIMFVANRAEDACNIALNVKEVFSSEDISAHGGVAFGEIIAHGGDYFGQVVNMAARLAELSVGDEILATSEVAKNAGSNYDLKFLPAGRRIVRGYPGPLSVFSVERTEAI